MTLEAVEIGTLDGVVLRGEFLPGGRDFAILVHDLRGDLDAWRPLAASLVAHGLAVLTFDLRGHGGSDGNFDETMTEADLRTTIAWAQRRGAKRIYLGSIGTSAGSVLEVGEQRAEAVFLVGPSGAGLERTCPLPRLVIVVSGDSVQADAARALRKSPGESVIVHISPDSGGASLLNSTWGPNVRDYVLAFLRQYRLRPPKGMEPTRHSPDETGDHFRRLIIDKPKQFEDK